MAQLMGGAPPYRLFLGTGEQVPVTAGSIRFSTDAIDATSVFSPFPQYIHGIRRASGNVELSRHEADLGGDLRHWQQEWRKRLTLARCWCYFNPGDAAMMPELFTVLTHVDGWTCEMTPDGLIAHIGVSFQADGHQWYSGAIPRAYLPQIIAFESSLPASLMAYHDWCEEQGWEERRQDLRRQWEQEQAMLQAPRNMAMLSPLYFPAL